LTGAPKGKIPATKFYSGLYIEAIEDGTFDIWEEKEKKENKKPEKFIPIIFSHGMGASNKDYSGYFK